METKLLTKEEVLSFNLWDCYFNFLTSIKEAFQTELSSRLGEEIIQSFVKSGFYNKDGTVKEDRTKDYPDSEEIRFEIEDKMNSVGLSYYYSDASRSCLDLYSVEEDDKTLRFIYSCNTDKLFSPEAIEAAVYWIQTGEPNDFIKNNFEEC